MKRIAETNPGPPAPRLGVADLCLALALSEAGSTAAAAHRLHLTQSAVSRALLNLEARLSQPLFERTARGLTPTAAGERLVQRAPQLLAALLELEAELCTPAIVPRALRLVCECYTAYHWLPTTLSGLRAHSPQLELGLAVDHTRDPVGALRRGDVDVALLTTARVEHPQLRERPLFSDEIVFLVARAHPLAERKALTRADLLAHPLLASTQTPEAEARWFMRKVFGAAPGGKLPRFERLPLTEAILDVARAGMGVAVMSAWIAGPHLSSGELVARRLQRGPLLRPWRIAYRREHEAAVEQLVPILQAASPRPPLAIRTGSDAAASRSRSSAAR
jgi:LysR family transcriptional regulator for metE and metH